MNSYYIYMLKCVDDSYYTGVTNDLERRLSEHNLGEIDGYTSRRLPVVLVFSEEFSVVEDAIEREKQIKGWSRAKKEALIAGKWSLLAELSQRNGLKNHASRASCFESLSMT